MKGPRIKINSRVLAVLTAIVASLTFILVFVFGRISLFWEFMISLAILSLVLFSFLFLGLYLGLTIVPKHVPQQWKSLKANSIGKMKERMRSKTKNGPLEIGGLDVVAPGPGDEGWGALLAVILWIIVTMIIIVVFIVIAHLLLGLVLFLMSCFYWLFYRAYRQVFLKAGICKGRLLPSMKYSLEYTILYTFWMFALVIGIDLIVRIF